MKRIVFTAILFVLVLFGASSPAYAQVEPPIVIPPTWNFDGLKIEYQRVDVTLAEQVATTHIEQLFVNENDWMLEGVYLFPLPAEAAVSQLTMWVDGTPIEAKILEKDEARQIYNEIVSQLRDPALLEYVGSSAIQANVFPIPPHSERRIEIEYSQILPAENGLVHYVYPQSTNLYTNTPLDSQNIRVEVTSNEAIRAIYSPSHPVAISRDGDFNAVVGYEEENVTPDQDFELYYTVSPEDIGLNLLSYREAGEDGFFVLLVAPSVATDELVAKDVILIVDTSGSMEGDKMAQAKEAALYVVDHLNPDDRFNIVSFSTGVRNYMPGLVSASEPGNYQSFINGLEALGGTNISQALLEAVAQADAERPTTILFLTDGLATEGITDTPLLLDSVQQATPSNVRIFAFGVGDDVDTNLLDNLAQNHRGTTTYVRPFQAIDEEVGNFYAKISAPVLTDISLDFGGMVVEQMYPQTLPDLFAGSQLVLTGRYRDGGAATITLSGTVNGQPKVFSYSDQFFRTQSGDEFIPRLWATRAIGHLLTEIRLHGENPELVQSVVNLSVRYGVITPYTSYLIEEDDIFSQAGLYDIAEQAAEEAMNAPTAPVSGFEAVEEAAASGALADAEAPMALPATETFANGESVSIDEVVRLVGSKTFVWRDGVWMDTAFNADAQTPQLVGFASPAYFDLITAVPDLGQYLALGTQVLVVHKGQVYQITEGEGVANVALPETAVSTPEPAPTTELPQNTIMDDPTVTSMPTLPGMVNTPPASSNRWSWDWVLVAVIGVILGAGFVIGRYGKRS